MVSLKKERFLGFFHSGYESLRESKPWSPKIFVRGPRSCYAAVGVSNINSRFKRRECQYMNVV